MNDHCILVDTAITHYDDGDDLVTEYETEFYEFCANQDLNATAAAVSYLNHDASKYHTILGEPSEIYSMEKCDRCSDDCPGKKAKKNNLA